MATSAIWELIDALVAKFSVNATLIANSVTVIDGPPSTGDLRAANLLFVGAAPEDPDDLSPDASFTQRWATLGDRHRDEELTLRCQLIVRSGSFDMAARRDTAQTLLAAIEADLRTDFTLSIGRLMYIQLAGAEVRQTQTRIEPVGTFVSVTFTLAARARLS